MKFKRRRASLFPRPDWRALHAPRAPLTGQTWFRGSSRARRPDSEPRRPGRRALAGALGAVALGLLAVTLFTPVARVRAVDVTGTRHLTTAEVIRLAGLQRPGSMFAVDSATVASRLAASPWVRVATVSTGLTGTVTIRVQEWQPVAVLAAAGRSWLVSDQGVVLGAAAGPQDLALVQIREPAALSLRQGERAIEVQLLVALVNMSTAMPSVVGEPVRSFDLDACGNLTMVAERGWQVRFGRVLTPEEYSSLADKFGSLRALAGPGGVNYNSPDLLYVNVMNPGSPAVGLKSARPAAGPAAPPGAGPGSPSPAATPSPTPTPTPNGPVLLGPSPGAPGAAACA